MKRLFVLAFTFVVALATIGAPVASAATYFQSKDGTSLITYYNNDIANQTTTTSSSGSTTTIPQTSAAKTNSTAPKTTTKPPASNKPNPGNGSYVALGDSVAAGLGLQGPTSGAPCGRTAQAYPNIVAQKRNLTLNHIACSGATVGDLVTKQRVSGPNVSSQLDQAFANGTPTLITITAGANDLGWLQFIKKCYAATCGSTADTAVVAGLRTAMEVKYKFALSEIQRRSNGTMPQVVVTGYYNPVSNYCKGKQTFATNAEINWLNGERDKLNKSIRKSINGYKYVKYASSNFDQHGVCAVEPWSQGINDPAPLHPTAKGQEQIAKSVLSQVR